VHGRHQAGRAEAVRAEGAKRRRSLRARPECGLGRFTPRARNVVVVAQNKANEAGNNEIGPDHLLLGLFADPDGLAPKLLAGQGIDADKVNVKVTSGEGLDAVGREEGMIAHAVCLIEPV